MFAGVLVALSTYVRSHVDNQINELNRKSDQTELRGIKFGVDHIRSQAEYIQPIFDLLSKPDQSKTPDEQEMYKKAVELWENKNLFDALTLAQQLIKLNPLNARNHFVIANIFKDLYHTFHPGSVKFNNPDKLKLPEEWYQESESSYVRAQKFASKDNELLYIESVIGLAMLKAGRGSDFEQPKAITYFDDAENMMRLLGREFPHNERVILVSGIVKGFREGYLSWEEGLVAE